MKRYVLLAVGSTWVAFVSIGVLIPQGMWAALIGLCLSVGILSHALTVLLMRRR